MWCWHGDGESEIRPGVGRQDREADAEGGEGLDIGEVKEFSSLPWFVKNYSQIASRFSARKREDFQLYSG